MTNTLRDRLQQVDDAAAASETPAGQAIATRPASVNELVVTPRIQESLVRALQGAMTPERFASLVMTVMRGSKQLPHCEPMTVIAAAVQAAQLGLEIGPLGEAYIVPYQNRDRGIFEAQFQLGYKGMVTLAHRSGVAIEAWPVHENDEFDYSRGTGANKYLRHKPATKRDRGEVYCYYMIAEWDGHSVFHVMSLDEIEDNRRRFSKQPDGPAWKNSFDAMACKTVVRAASKWVPKAVHLNRALAADDTVNYDIEPDMAERAWATQQLEQQSTPATPTATISKPLETAAGDAAPVGPCEVCNWTDGHADGCEEETTSR